MKIKAASTIFLWIIYFLFAFPLFYFVYKFGNPNFGCKDFFDYYKLYNNWDIRDVEAPFNMRLVGPYLVYLLNKTGLYYQTATAFDQFNLNKHVFFNAIFFNYLCVATTCVIVFKTVAFHFGNRFMAFASGLIYLLGFGTIFYEIMPLTDAFSVLLFAIVLAGYLRKKYFIMALLPVLIFQREYIFMALGLVALIDFIRAREKYYVHTLLACVACFAIYYLLRKTVFYTARYNHQASAGFFLHSLIDVKIPIIPYIKQTIMTMNLFIIYLLVLAYKRVKGLSIDKNGLLKLLLLLVQINLVSIAAVFGNNAGRYFYILVPLVIFELAKESRPLINTTNSAA